MRVLITGATGFVGKTLLPYIYAHGYTDIAIIVRNEDKAKRLFQKEKPLLINNQLHSWQEQVKEYNPDIVFHLAAMFTGRCDPENAEKIINTNVLFGTLLLEALSHTNCRMFVNIGTFTEYLYGNGEYFANNLYSASKTAFRPIIQFFQARSTWKWVNVVVYSPYGRINGQKKVIDFMADALGAEEPVKFSGGRQILDFIHVDDMADFFLTLLDRQDCITVGYMQFHLGTGQGHSLREVGHIMEQLSGLRLNADWGAYPYRPYDPMYAVAPIARNIEMLSWRHRINIKEGIMIYLNELSVTNND